MQVHLNAAQTGQAQEGELSLNFLKKYIGYCRKYVIKISVQFPLAKFNGKCRVSESLTIEASFLYFYFL